MRLAVDRRPARLRPGPLPRSPGGLQARPQLGMFGKHARVIARARVELHQPDRVLSVQRAEVAGIVASMQRTHDQPGATRPVKAFEHECCVAVLAEIIKKTSHHKTPNVTRSVTRRRFLPVDKSGKC